MTARRPDEPRRSRVLPVVVFSLFALVFLGDVGVVALVGNYRNLVEENGVEVSFRPEAAPSDTTAFEIPDGGRMVSTGGVVQVERIDDRVIVNAAGELVIRFRAPNAGGVMEMAYRFAEKRPDSRCDVVVARVASRYGVDVVRRRSLAAAKRRRGCFRHQLADHAGWFELSLRVNQAAAVKGFEITLPTISWP